MAEGNNEAIEQQADQFVRSLLSREPSDIAAKQESKQVVETIALDLQKQAAAQSELLKAPLQKISKRSEDGGEIATSLINLKVQVEELDPNKLNLEAGWFSRMVGSLPGVGTPLKRYFSRYESAQTVISAIVRSLETGRDQLNRDNITLAEDQKRMGEMTAKLEQAIALGQAIDNKLQYAMEREVEPGSDKQKFIGEELLFPLRQRIMDLQQQLAVNQQGILAMELIIRNNKELMRGVNRALSVTISALQTAVTVAMALENQKIVLDKLDAVNRTTSDLISGTASRLRTQGVEIQKRASSTQLSMESLKSAFADLSGALEDISQFRAKALPEMAQNVLQLDQMTADSKKVIQKMELGRAQQPTLEIENQAQPLPRLTDPTKSLEAKK